MNEICAREELVNICTRLYDRKLTVSAGGNMSVRLDEKCILITPSGRNKGMLRPEDLVKVGMDGKVIGEGKPSIETKFHLAIYKANKEANAVVHCHPLYCTALAIEGKKITFDLTPEGILLLGDVPMVKYRTPGSKELVDEVAKNSKSYAMIMERHGALTYGRNLEEAFNRMEELEFQAHLHMIEKDATPLPKDEIKKIRSL